MSSPDVRQLFNTSIPFKSDGKSVEFTQMTGMAFNLDHNFSSLRYRPDDYIDHFDMADDLNPIESVVLADYGKLSIIYGHNKK